MNKGKIYWKKNALMWKFVFLWRRCRYLLVCQLTKIIKGWNRWWWLCV